MYTTIIGLEIHVQLRTRSKMFCRCSNEGELRPPNTTVCPICLGHPGTLPVANRQAIDWAAKTALALGCEIPHISKFDRKNYFYPDLPKGYQISQYDQPIGLRGFLDIDIDEKRSATHRKEARIVIRRLHLEEDAAKLVHSAHKDVSLVDFNRACTPLMEIVTEPDLRTPGEAYIFLQELRQLVRYLDVSSADMEKGQLRCDANISLEFDYDGRRVATPITEIKNLNSFRAVERSLTYEASRLYQEWLDGGDVRTRTSKITVGWDDTASKTILQRWKEEAHDYRYFPEPDLPPLTWNQEQLDQLRSSLPELPAAKRARFIAQYGISSADAVIIVNDKPRANFFEQAASELDEWLASLATEEANITRVKAYTTLSSWLVNKLESILSDEQASIAELPLTAENFGQLIALIMKNAVTGTSAFRILEVMVRTGGDPIQIMRAEHLEQICDEGSLEAACDSVIAANPNAVMNYRNGKANAIMFLVGSVMKVMKGKSQPEMVRGILERKIQLNRE
ncbi:Asp-tRNA(Asn)/Glu-tRNA(Gln) amidotransferase subunit GatB [Candidatus Uhrbacteria bacterium]|nr:Asp-tRNA(Asn)/Glu-tRNA(Gln) amidotransferase subunit GatB [Candidatus Uhrbacteria bacterium]